MRGSAKVWVLAFLAAAGLGLGGLIGIGCAIGANLCPWADVGRLATTDGEQLFGRLCIDCHGVGGAGTARGPSIVTGEPAAYSFATVRAKILDGRPFGGMPAFKRDPRVDESQVDAIARYVIELRETG